MASKFQPVTVQAPKCLNDFALQPNSRFKLESILDQTLNFPANGVCCILLYGLYGTGKTTIARLLPGLIETSKKDPNAPSIDPGDILDTQDPHEFYQACAQGQNGAHLIQTIQNMTNLIAFNQSGLHYVILDEVDNLTDLAQASFKAILNHHHVVFIMTTNNLNKIDLGIQNRSVLVDMNIPPADLWRPILRKVYQTVGLTPPPDAALDQVVVAGRGSARTIFTDVVMDANQNLKKGVKASRDNVVRLRS
jgi:DNA polymerase III delta prime subunit